MSALHFFESFDLQVTEILIGYVKALMEKARSRFAELSKGCLGSLFEEIL